MLTMGIIIQNLFVPRYEDFLNLYGGGRENSIFTTGIKVPLMSDMDPNVPERLLRP